VKLDLPALVLVAATPFGTAQAAGGTYHVDPLTGSDESGDGSAAAPWRTVSHALASVPLDDDLLLLAAGTYDAATGESFPLTVPTGVRLRGAGQGLTVLEGEPDEAVLRLHGYETYAYGFEPVASRLTVRGGDYAVTVLPGVDPQVGLSDLRLEGALAAGVLVLAEGHSATVRRSPIAFAHARNA